jgi:hypothetical protein
MAPMEISRTDEHFREVTRQLRVCAYGETKMDWAMGDLVLRECPNPGPGRTIDLPLLEAYADESGISYHTLSTHRRVSEAFPIADRVDDISWSVHRVFTSLPVPTRFMVLHRAGGWTVEQAQEYMSEATGSLTSGQEYEHQAEQIHDDLEDLPANFRDIALAGMAIPPLGKGTRPGSAGRSGDSGVLSAATAISAGLDRLNAAYTGQAEEITSGTDDFMSEQLGGWQERIEHLRHRVSLHRQDVAAKMTSDPPSGEPF